MESEPPDADSLLEPPQARLSSHNSPRPKMKRNLNSFSIGTAFYNSTIVLVDPGLGGC